jgi:hypothetical protein
MSDYDEAEYEEIAVTQLLRDEGSIVLFQGIDSDGAIVNFGVDHRPARDILDAIEAGEDPVAYVPEWAILARRTVAP